MTLKYWSVFCISMSSNPRVGVATPVRTSSRACRPPARPFFVSMMMTPLLAREPSIDALDASFSTWISPMSAGFKKFR